MNTTQILSAVEYRLTASKDSKIADLQTKLLRLIVRGPTDRVRFNRYRDSLFALGGKLPRNLPKIEYRLAKEAFPDYNVGP